MNLLLDTHIWLWWMESNPRLSKEIVSAISSPDNAIYVSSISVWEVAIKSQGGKIRWDENLVEVTKAEGISILAFDALHAAATQQLPLHNKDPFDRALLGQAQSEGLTFVTADGVLRQYGAFVNIRCQA